MMKPSCQYPPGFAARPTDFLVQSKTVNHLPWPGHTILSLHAAKKMASSARCNNVAGIVCSESLCQFRVVESSITVTEDAQATTGG